MKRYLGAPAAVLLLVWLHQLALDWLSPIAQNDWLARIGDRHALTTHDLLHALLARVPWTHAVISPLLVVALILGIATLALGRAPSLGRGGDAVALLLASAFVWLGAPRAELVLSYRDTAAGQLIGACGAVWLVVACTRAGRAPAAAAVVLGILVGASTRELGTAALVLALAAAIRHPRARLAAGGLAIGVALIWLAPPAADLDLAWMRGPTRLAHDVIYALRRPAVVGAVLAFAALVCHALRKTPIATDTATATGAAPLLDRAAAAAAAALAIAIVVELSPRPDSTQLFGAGVAIAIPATRFALDLTAGARRFRIAIIAAAIALHAAVAWFSLYELRVVHRDAAARIALLEAAPLGTIAAVPAYRRTHGTDNVLGEDFFRAELRDRVATRELGLRGIAITPALHAVEPVSPLALHARVEGPPEAAAALPAWYSADAATAAQQLAEALPAARAAGIRDVQLVVDTLAVPSHPGVPVVAAWLSNHAVTTWPIVTHGAPPDGDDDLGRIRLQVHSGASAPDEVWALPLGTLRGDQRTPRQLELDPDGGDVYLLPRDREAAYAIVACAGSRCALGRVVWFW